jgi:putative glutamine amidotransferase
MALCYIGGMKLSYEALDRHSADQSLIGITGRRQPAVTIDSGDPPSLVSGLFVDGFYSSYATQLATAGAMPVCLVREARPAKLVDRLDALVLAGGLDVDPRLYDGRLTTDATLLDPEQDEFEIALVRCALEREVPILGTCRGHQLLNVALGGTLHCHLDGSLLPYHNRTNFPLGDRGHRVRFQHDSALGGLYGPTAEVNSFHHQAVDRLGDGLTAVAFAEDGVIEAVELEGGAAIGVQWHPEFAPHVEPVLKWLVEVAR